MCVCNLLLCVSVSFFFFKQKTAYEMRISDWSSDVCSSDLIAPSGELGRLAFDLRESPLAWFRGYAGDPEKSAEKFSPDERWYLAGDVARADGDGNFYFASRDDDVIIMAG